MHTATHPKPAQLMPFLEKASLHHNIIIWKEEAVFDYNSDLVWARRTIAD
jgi:hypothetical protein